MSIDTRLSATGFDAVNDEALSDVNGGVVPLIVIGGLKAIAIVGAGLASFMAGYNIGKDIAKR
jgi:lactobin A/cerein 7B family class IIb bacteriocin